MRPTIALKSALVGWATNDTLTGVFGLGGPCFKSDNPSILFCLGHSLEGVLVTMEAEAEIVEIALDYIGNVTLSKNGMLAHTLPNRKLSGSQGSLPN